jgi:hypothetical protein
MRVVMVHKYFPYVPCINNENWLIHPLDCLVHTPDCLAHPLKIWGALNNLGGALEI